MRTALYIILLLLTAVGPAKAQSAEAQVFAAELQLPDAEQIIEQVQAALPTQTIELTGECISRRRSRSPEVNRWMELRLQWTATPPQAAFLFKDRFGSDLAGYTLTYGQTGPDIVFEGTNASVNIYEPLHETDFALIDLSFGFLWWPERETLRYESYKGRDCYVLILTNPEKETPYDTVHLWIDEKVYAPLQAVAFGTEGARVKRMEVLSFKKADDLWMIKDLRVTTYPDGHKTRLKVHDINS